MNNLPTQSEIIAQWKGSYDKPIVSICCIAYNHELYIRDAIKGFLIQQTDFPFEVLIHDDASTDNTAGIIKEFEKKYPKIIKPIYQHENQYSKGKKINPDFNYPRAKGEFIALCEGDDYWTAKDKLYKQVKYLSSHSEYSMTSHAVKFKFDGVREKRDEYKAKPIIDASFEDIISHGLFIALNSIVYRKEMFEVPQWAYEIPGGHKALIYLITSKGMNHHFIEEMAVKRRNPGGMTIRLKDERAKTYYDRNIFLLENLKIYLNHSKDDVINARLRRLYFKKIIRSFLYMDFSGAFCSFLDFFNKCRSN